MHIPLTKYGLREIIIATLVCAVLATVAAVLFWPIVILPAVVWVYVICFFRDPPRRPAEQEAFICPADGRVVDITPVDAQSPLGTDGVRIGIFMSIFDVHVNRSPFDATVEKIEHHNGGHADARKPEASERNESATIRLTANGGDGQAFPLIVRQIAGLIARRIVTDLRVGQQVTAGQRIGMVKFGSRVEVMIPLGLVGQIAVRVGQTVAVGQRIGMVKFGSRVELMVPHGLIGQIAVKVGQTVRAGRTVLIRLPDRSKPEGAY